MTDRRLISCWAAAALGAGLTCYLLYPGTMDVDGLLQLEEGRTGVFYDWHPPLMAWLWSGVDRVVPGPFGMLLLQNAMFWSGLGLVVYHLGRSASASVMLILGIGALPPILSALGTIWKDVQMGAALLLAFALLLHAHRRQSLLWLSLAVPVLCYALGVRHNAALAGLPLCLWAGQLTSRRALPRARRPVLATVTFGVLLLLALEGFVQIATARLVRGRRLYPEQQVMLHDLLAISVKSGSVLVPAFFADRPILLSDVACLYTPDDAVAAFSARRGACPLRLHKLTRFGDVSQLRGVWPRAIIDNPRAYAAHRRDVWRSQLALHRGRVCYPLATRTPPNRLGIDVRTTPRYGRALRLFTIAAYDTPLFRGWPYLVIAFLTLPLAVLTRFDPGPIVVLGSSAVLYELGYLGVATACAFRMNWWPIVAAVLALAIVLGRNRRNVPSRPLVGTGESST